MAARGRACLAEPAIDLRPVGLDPLLRVPLDVGLVLTLAHQQVLLVDVLRIDLDQLEQPARRRILLEERVVGDDADAAGYEAGLAGIAGTAGETGNRGRSFRVARARPGDVPAGTSSAIM